MLHCGHDLVFEHDRDPGKSSDASASPASVTFDGGSSVQLFTADSGINVELDGLRLTNGYAGCSGGSGGVIYMDGGDLTLTGDTVSGNTSCQPGGAISRLGDDNNLPVNSFIERIVRWRRGV